jgi:hypothetical protein
MFVHDAKYFHHITSSKLYSVSHLLTFIELSKHFTDETTLSYTELTDTKLSKRNSITVSSTRAFRHDSDEGWFSAPSVKIMQGCNVVSSFFFNF